MGGFNPTLRGVLVGAAGGAAVGLIGMVLIDTVINGRYFLANRAEAKAQRLRAESRSATAPNPRDDRRGPTE